MANHNHTPEQIAGDFTTFERKVHAALPATEIIYISMRKHTVLVVTMATAAISMFILSSHLMGAERFGKSALTGQVRSIEEGPMEGVLVSARQEGSTVTITVVSDEQGRYSFPSTNVAPGRYAIRIRAVGYDLDGVNLSSGPVWSYSLKTLPRPTGASTRVIITEYDLPRKTIEPHDVVVDPAGAVWFSNFGEQFLGRLDPKPGRVTEYPVPLIRPGFPTGMLDLETDQEGNLWLSMMYQGGIARFDKKTGTFKTWTVPPEFTNNETQQSMVGPQHWEVDGKVWLNDAGGATAVYRMDMATGAFEKWTPYKDLPPGPHSVYGIYSDSKNNLFFLDFGGENVGRIDAKTRKLALFPTPTPRSRPRRGRMDAQDRLWFGEFYGGKIGMFDTKTEKFQEWAVSTPHTAPYAVVLDKNGEVWGAGMEADRIMRVDPGSGRFIEY